MITANSGYKIGNDLSDIIDCYVFHETTPEELNLGNKLIDIGINTFTIGVSALSAHLTQAEYQKALNSTPSNGNISDKAKWINTDALDDASSKIDDVMIEARNSGMVLEGGSNQLLLEKTPNRRELAEQKLAELASGINNKTIDFRTNLEI